MGLAGPSNKVKVGLDPRNTAWANDTGRFGHQQMLRMGWTPGKGLGFTNIGSTSHVKVKAKRDNVGLGKDLSVDDQPHGLDVFQALLGRLNGNEEKVSRQLAEKNRQNGVYLNFVSGGVLEGTIEKMLDTKRARDKNYTSKEAHDRPSKKSNKESKKESKQHKKAAKKVAKEAAKEASKRERKAKKEKKKIAKSEAPGSASPSAAPIPRGIRATRSRFIAMKKQATADDKGLQEILMSLN